MRRQFSKRNIILLLLICSFLLMNGCTSPQGNRERIISAYQKNEDVFIDAVQSGDYSTVELLSIVKTVSDTLVRINDVELDVRTDSFDYRKDTKK